MGGLSLWQTFKTSGSSYLPKSPENLGQTDAGFSAYAVEARHFSAE